jgi:hypothetical protein
VRRGLFLQQKTGVKKKKGGSTNTTNVSSVPNFSTDESVAVDSSNCSKRKNAFIRATGFISPGGSRLALENEIQEDENENGSKPSNVWCDGHDSMTVAESADKTTVTLVVTQQVFPMSKFLDRDTELMFSDKKQSICQFVLERCNLHADISQRHWWKTAQKNVTQTISRLRNDRNTAMKWAMLGKYHWRYGMY